MIKNIQARWWITGRWHISNLRHCIRSFTGHFIGLLRTLLAMRGVKKTTVKRVRFLFSFFFFKAACTTFKKAPVSIKVEYVFPTQCLLAFIAVKTTSNKMKFSPLVNELIIKKGVPTSPQHYTAKIKCWYFIVSFECLGFLAQILRRPLCPVTCGTCYFVNWIQSRWR